MSEPPARTSAPDESPGDQRSPWRVSWRGPALERPTRLRAWSDRPLTRTGSIAVLVLGLVSLPLVGWITGGVIGGDASEILPSAWAIAHGNWHCAFPVTFTNQFASGPIHPIPVVAAPLYSLLLSAPFALAGLWARVPFPAAHSFGGGCAAAQYQITLWMREAHLDTFSLWSMILGWSALIAAVWFALSRFGPRRRGVHLIVVGALAVSPALFQSILVYYHPQDLLAIALAIAALVYVIRDQWVAAGVLSALGLLTQQFDLFLVIPLAVLALRGRTPRYLVALSSTYAAVALVLVALTRGAVLRAIIFGSDRLTLTAHSVHSSGGTWLSAIGPPTWVAFIVARVLPVLASVALTWWVARRVGPRVTSPEVLVALIGLSFSLRILFEMNMFAYYFAATYVFVVLAWARSRIEVGAAVLGLAIMWIGFDPILFAQKIFGLSLTPSYLPIPAWVTTIVLLAMVLLHLRARRVVISHLVALAGFVMLAHGLLFSRSLPYRPVPFWLLQLILVALAAYALTPALRVARPDRTRP